jgi:PEP-CTERM motif
MRVLVLNAANYGLSEGEVMNNFRVILLGAFVLCGLNVTAMAELAGGTLPPGTPLQQPFPQVWTIMEPNENPVPSPITEIYGFVLPGPVAPGDVVLLEPGWAGLPDDPMGWSDVFAFGDPGTPLDTVHLYSDPSDEVTPLNLGRPLNNPVFLTEPPTLPEIVTYQVSGVTYTLISDVPEPSSFVLICIGSLSMIAFAWRRWK